MLKLPLQRHQAGWNDRHESPASDDSSLWSPGLWADKENVLRHVGQSSGIASARDDHLMCNDISKDFFPQSQPATILPVHPKKEISPT